MKLTYISILRSLSILVVVFFHVYQYMYVPAHFPETVQMYHDTYFWFNQCVGINIAMPMFTLIAGFLFSYLLVFIFPVLVFSIGMVYKKIYEVC